MTQQYIFDFGEENYPDFEQLPGQANNELMVTLHHQTEPFVYLWGNAGSGKTYYAVDKIYNNFSTDKEAKKDKHVYDVCYTNINEFEFEKVNNVLLLDFDDLKSKLATLHKLYKEKNSDDVLIEFCKEHNIYNSY